MNLDMLIAIRKYKRGVTELDLELQAHKAKIKGVSIRLWTKIPRNDKIAVHTEHGKAFHVV